MINKTSSFDQQSFNYGVTQENKLNDPRIKMKDDESEWLQGNECIVCDLNFSKCGKLHHCRVCGNPVCKTCSYKMINDKRSCDLCFKRIQLVDQEKLKKQQIKTKKEAIQELKNQISKQQQQNDLMKNQLIDLQKQLEIQQREHTQQEKSLEDQFEQKINMIRQQIENNKRQDQNITTERIQLEEIERDIIDLRNNIETKEFNIQNKRQFFKSQNKDLQKCQEDLLNLQLSLEQKKQEKLEQTEKEQIEQTEKELKKKHENRMKEQSEEYEKQITEQTKQQKHKENCIIY
ncbi:unnamed protein product [Paramecium pentaurelia]|uniref:FYVE-type domain-containing protein n=1 Tax=Paramecium pentaurelia TaxID=43138 RepID=A0A8S1ST18_9CILI|nr:unnamed protein product [Paramecium pentaurelia]